MASVDEVIAAIHAAGPLPDRWPKSYVAALRGAAPAVLGAPGAGGLNPLHALDAAEHSAGFAAVLAAQLAADPPPPDALPLAAAFAARLSRDQLLLAPDLLTAVGRGVLRVAEAAGAPLLAVRTLLAAIARFAAHPGHLTALHPLLLRACLLARAYKPALAVIDVPITDVEPVCDTRIQDFLLYHYYAGMVLEGLGKHARALDALALAITAPAQVTSAIQIEAYKKFVLISLKEHGRIRALPKYMAPCVGRAAKAKAGPYLELAAAYESGSVSRLRSEYQKHQAQFAKDRNDGLAKQLVDALWRRNVAKLTQTYVTLSLDDIAKQLGMDSQAGKGGEAAEGLPDLESLLRVMVENDEIDAAVDQRQGMVEFRDPPAGYDDEQSVRKLNELIDRTLAVNESVVKMDRQLGVSRDFLSKQVQAEKGGGGGAVSFSGLMDDEAFAETAFS
ncbi:hypothetical protein DFJ74DRAFT_626169 [Hyaloraphidium curvatum]|nr:hypothetical protein DFJ74DRAFT_626169 [Hyaloraphidium curvatum]